MRRFSKAGSLALMATMACSASEFRMSPEGQQKAATVLKTIDTDLEATCTSGPESARFNQVTARARAELAQLRGVVKTKADRAAMLLIASVLMRNRERCTLIQMGADSTHEAVTYAENERQACATELAPWLEGKGTEELLKTPCLAEAEAAAQTLLTK